MSSPPTDDPRPGVSYVNPLMTVLGPTLHREALFKALKFLPSFPLSCCGEPIATRLIHAHRIRELYLPTADSLAMSETLEIMLRHGYLRRDPSQSSTWARVYRSDGGLGSSACSPALYGAVFAVSGTGKSRTIGRTLSRYPATADIEHFPNLAKPLRQIVYIKVDVPASGRAIDLVETLMRVTDSTLGTARFAELLARKGNHKRAASYFEEWRQFVTAHFLGILIIDEVQNLFKIQTLSVRDKRLSQTAPRMRVIDDESLKQILLLTTDADFPVFLSGTPDGEAALESRLSTSQRLSTAGIHTLSRITSLSSDYFQKHFFPALFACQCVDEPADDSAELRETLLALSGGVPRILVMLWVASQRCCLEQRQRKLRAAHLTAAMQTYLAPLKPALAALTSNNPQAMRRYHDLLPDMDSIEAGLTRM